MPRARKTQLKAEDDELPIRSTSRKRKLVEYAEVDSTEDALDGESENDKDSEATNEHLKSPQGRRKAQKSASSKVTESQAASSRWGKTKTTAAIQTGENHTTSEETDGLLKVEQEAVVEELATKSTPSKTQVRSKASDTQTLDQSPSEASSDDDTTTKKPKPKRKRKTKEEKEAEAMPLATRTPNLRMFVGAHTSIAKGIENAITNCIHIGGNAFACFLKSQRKWDNPALKVENRDLFRSHLITHKYDATKHIVPHGSYLVNLASADPEMAKKSYDAFLDDLRRCEDLGITYYNFHPGSAGQAPIDEAIGRLANNLNRALAATSTVTPLLENMATRGSIIGGHFSDLSSVIALIEPKFKSRIGVCIDTCHAFASGYDLRSSTAFAATLADFDQTVGIQYLKALHLNDSKAPFASNRDLHQNIGLGFLGLRAFHNVMNESQFQDLPLILETPCEKLDPSDPKKVKMVEDKSIWATEIKLLESLIGMDAESAEFKELERDLAEMGKVERMKMQKQFDEKVAKERKKVAREREKGQKSLVGMFGGKGKKGIEKGGDEGSEGREEVFSQADSPGR